MKILFVSCGFSKDGHAGHFTEYHFYHALATKHEMHTFGVKRPGSTLSKVFLKEYNSHGACWDTKACRDNYPDVPRRGFPMTGQYIINYNQVNIDELYEHINSSDYDLVLSSHYLIDKTKINCPSVVIVHDTMRGLCLEAGNTDHPEYYEILSELCEYELDMFKSRVDLVLTLSRTDEEYIAKCGVPTRMLPQCTPYNTEVYEKLANTVCGSPSDMKYDGFYAGTHSWFRTDEVLEELVKLPNCDKLLVYLPGGHPDRFEGTEKFTYKCDKDPFDNELYMKIKYGVLPYEYMGGVPTKVVMAMSNGLPYICKGNALNYVARDEEDLVKDFLLSYNTINELDLIMNSWSPIMKFQAIEFVKNHRGYSATVNRFDRYISEVFK